MNLQNFNINNIIKNSDPNQRAMILFDAISKEVILGVRTLEDNEKEILSETFKTNHEVDIYNKYYKFYNQMIIAILEIDKAVSKIEYFKCLLLNIIQDFEEKDRVVDQMMEVFDKVLEDGLIDDSKKKEFITRMVMLIANVEDKTKYDFLHKFFKLENKNDKESQIEVFQNFAKIIRNKIKLDLESILFCQGFLREKYQNFDIKFSAIDDKILMVDKDIEKTKDFIDGFCGVLIN